MKKSFTFVSVAAAVFFGCANMPMVAGDSNAAGDVSVSANGSTTSKYQTVTIVSSEKKQEKQSLVDYEYNIGLNHVDVLGPVFLKSDGHCSEVELFRYATTVYQGKRVDNIIHVRMEETSETFGQDESAAMAAAAKRNAYVEASSKKRESSTYSCKASALAVSYSPIPVEQSAEWFKVVGTPLGQTSEKESKEVSGGVSSAESSANVSAEASETPAY